MVFKSRYRIIHGVSQTKLTIISQSVSRQMDIVSTAGLDISISTNGEMMGRWEACSKKPSYRDLGSFDRINH